MEALKKLGQLTMLFALVMMVMPSFAQEYDDLYFTSKDRKKVEKLEEAQNKSTSTYESYTNNTYSDNYSTHQVNPEYIARYQSDSEYADENANDENPNATYSEPSMSNISYFDEDRAYEEYDNYNQQAQGTTVINNYYSNNPFRNSWYNDPWYAGNSMWYDPWYGWNTGWRISVGFGWRNSWAFNPYYDPYWNIGYASGFGYYDPYWGWNTPYSYGWNRWNRYNYAYTNGFYSGYYYGSNSGYVNDSPRRNVVVGSRSVRGGTVAQGSRSSSSRINSTTSARNNVDSRDFSRTQNEYYSRSRSSSGGRVTSTASNSSRSSANNYSSRSSSSRTASSTYGNRSGSSSNNTSRSSSGVSTSSSRS